MTGSNAVLAVGLLLIVWSLIRAHRDRRNWIDLQDLLRGDDGRISRGAVLILGSFGMGSWVVWKLATAGTLTAELFLGYCAVFAAPAITKLVTTASVDKARVTPAPMEPTQVVGAQITVDSSETKVT